jgi:hypothetical protein
MSKLFVILGNKIKSMRIQIFIAILISSVAANAQTSSATALMDSIQNGSSLNSNHTLATNADKKWFLNSYKSISTSYNFFNGGSAFIVSAPIGLQLNRKITNNVFAFAGVSVASAYVNFNRSFISSDVNKMYPNNSFRSNSLGMYSRAEVGLMYVNDARTFSISGSFGVERSSNPFFPYQSANTARSSHLITPNR